MSVVYNCLVWSTSRLLRIKYARKLIIASDEKDLRLLLLDADVPPRHPDYLRRISKAKYDAQFSKKVIKIYEPQEKSSKGITRPSLRRYAIILPLTVGPSQVIPIPFILDTGAPEFIYLCTSAMLALTEVGALTQTTQRGYNYQLNGSLQCPGDIELYNPMANALPCTYEKTNPHDIRLNLLGIKTIDRIIPDLFC